MSMMQKTNQYRSLALGLILAGFPFHVATAQQEPNEADVAYVRSIFDKVLSQSSCYQWLDHLCHHAPKRVSGSSAYMSAVEYTTQMLDSLGCTRVYKQPVMVPHWERGTVERASIVNSTLIGTQPLSVVALGFSAPTPVLGVTAEVIEVHSLDELEALPDAKVKGKIVFFNRPMDPTLVNTFHAYGQAVDQRGYGPKIAAKKGAVGCVVRSMTLLRDDVPHSGGTRFDEGVAPIPAAALGILSAERLSDLLKKEPNAKINLELNCRQYADKLSYSVIGEIRGSEFPDEIIVVGGHLDTWDIGEGAHDDGAGCVQSMEVLHIFKRLGYKPKRTIRCVLFANEENGIRGAIKYAEEALKNKENHIAAIESDAGGHAPKGFTVDGLPELMSVNMPDIMNWRNILAQYGAFIVETGGAGADVGELKPQGTLLFGLRPESQRYFDFHHASTDLFETVHKRELELGAGTLAALVYFIDQYGVKK
jgi:hypothetical protein